MKALMVLEGVHTGTEVPGQALVSPLTAIANQPLPRYWLQNLRDAGITQVGVLADPETSGLAATFGHGGRFGVSLQYLTASRISEARTFLGADDFVVCRGRSLLPDGIVELVKQFRVARPPAQLVVQKVAEPTGRDTVELDADGGVVRFGGDTDGAGNLAIVGAYFCTSAVYEALDAVTGQAGGVAELHHAIRWLLDRGTGVGTQRHYGYWKEIRTPQDALDGNRRLLGALRTDLIGEVTESRFDGSVVVAAGAIVRRCRITGPVIIDQDTVIEDSDLGPNVSVGADCRVRHSSLVDSIVLSGAPLIGTRKLRDMVVGPPATARSGGGIPQRATRLRARGDRNTPGLLIRSLGARQSAFRADADDAADWLAQRTLAQRFKVTRIPLTELDGWSTDRQSGNLVHRNGDFFSVQGLDVSIRTVAPDSHREWRQPIVVQPEIGIRGLLAREFDGALHFLMRARMEPGNANRIQFAPTVQAARSDYTWIHRGAPVPYLEYFTQPGRGRVINDVLQSEHGSWFCHKVNRNIIVAVDEDVPVGADFYWLTLGQLGQLLNRDNIVAMDARNVLACVPAARTATVALHSDAELLSWFTAEQSRYDIRARRIPLNSVHGWRRGTWSIGHKLGRHFRVVGVSVHADNRRVTEWTQPLVAPAGRGVCAFVMRRIGGVPHLLVQARATGGFLDRIELGPTVQCLAGHYGSADRPPFLDLVQDAAADRIRYSTVQSEDGSRLLNAENQYLIVETDESEAPTQPPSGYQWTTAGQLSDLLRHPHYVNIQARTLLAAINTGAANRFG